MATNLPTQATGDLIDAPKWNAIVNAVNAESIDLDTVEGRTTNTSGTVGIGNQRLSDRLGSGVTNTTDVTTGTATAQLTNVRSRLTTLEAASPIVKAVEYQLTGGTLPLIGQDVRIVWNTAVRTNAAITYNATTGLFTAVASGYYSGNATFRISALDQWYVGWAKGSTNAGGEFAKDAFANLNGSVTFNAYFMTAGTTFGAYGWAATPATTRYARQTAGDPLPLCTIQYLGP